MPTLVSQQSGSIASATGGTATVTATTSHNTLLFNVQRSGGLSTGALTGVTDNASNTWVLLTRGTVSGGVNTRNELWVCYDATSTTSISFTSSTAQTSTWDLTQWSGVATSSQPSAVSPDNSGTASTNTPTTPSITAGAGDLLYASTHCSIVTGGTPGAGWTALTNWDDAVGIGRSAYQLSATAGSVSCTWSTLSAAKTNGVLIVALKAAATSQGTADTATFSFAGSAAGTESAQGANSSATFTLSGTASGTISTSGTTSGTFVETGSAVGSAPQSGSSTGTFVFTGVASGNVPTQGSATGTFNFAGTASGSTIKSGSSTGTSLWAGSAVGSAPNSGSSTGGTLVYSGAAAGSNGSVRLFAAESPNTAANADTNDVNLGVEFSVSTSAWVTAVMWFQPTTNGPTTNARTVAIYTAASGSGGTPLATATATPVGSGWQTVSFSSPVALTAGTRYHAVTFHPGGQYSANSHYFDSGAYGTGSTDVTISGVLTTYGTSNTTSGNGSYSYAGSITNTDSNFHAANYWTDVLVSTVSPVTSQGSADGSTLNFAGMASGTQSPAGISSGTMVETATASGAIVVSGTSSGSLAFTGSAAGTKAMSGTTSGTFVYSGTATGSAIPGGAATSTFVYAGSAVGQTINSGSSSSTFTLAGTGNGYQAPIASSTGTAVFTGTATGFVNNSGTASGTQVWTGSAVGAETPSSVVTGTFLYAAVATGNSPGTGTGTALSTFVFAGGASGARVSSGSASGTMPFNGVSSGVITVSGSSTGTIVFSGNSAGNISTGGSCSGTFILSGTSSGIKTVANEGTIFPGNNVYPDTNLFPNEALYPSLHLFPDTDLFPNTPPVNAYRSGDGSGVMVFAGVATGTSDPQGSVSGSFVFDGTGSGITAFGGSVNATVSWTGTAYSAYSSDIRWGFPKLDSGITGFHSEIGGFSFRI